MDTAQATINDRFGKSTVATTMSLDGCDEVNMTGCSGSDHEENVVMTNNNDSNSSNSEDQAEGAIAEMSDANNTLTSGKKEKSGGKFAKEKGKTRFLGVRQRPSGRWVAEIKDSTQNIRLWLGTYDTTEDAARAYDDAARALRGANTCTNFDLSEGSQPEIKSMAVRLLLQRAAALAHRHATISEPQTTNCDGANSLGHHLLQRQQPQNCSEEGSSLFSHNGKVVNFSLEADQPDSSQSSANRNSSTGRGAQQHHHQSTLAGQANWSGTPAPNNRAELGSSPEEKFINAFVEMSVQLPSQHNEDFGDRDRRTQLGSSSASGTCSYGEANYDLTPGFLHVGRGDSMSAGGQVHLINHIACSPVRVIYEKIGEPPSMYNVNPEQQHNTDRSGPILPWAAQDVVTRPAFGAPPPV